MNDQLPTTTLDELVTLQSEKVFVNKNPDLPYVGLEHIAQGWPQLIGIGDSLSSISTNAIFAKNDILFGKLRPNLRKSLIAPFDGYCSTDILVLRPRPGVVPSFAGRVFQWENVFAFATSTAVGTKMPRTSWADLKNLVVFKPSFPSEQAQIAFVLDTLDDAITNLDAVIAKIRRVRTGLLDDLMTLGLDEHGCLRDPLSHPEQFKESAIGSIPQNWKVCKLRQALQTPPRNGYSPKEAPTFQGSYVLGLGCLTPEGFSTRQLKSAPSDNPRLLPFRLNDGDLLISRSNTRELVALPGVFRDIGYPCYYPDLMMRLSPKSDLLAQFLELLLRYSIARRRLVSSASGTSGSMVKITGADVMETTVAYPSLDEGDEQRQILALKDSIDEELRSTRAERKKLSLIRSGLMSDLLSGRVRVSESIPSEAKA